MNIQSIKPVNFNGQKQTDKGNTYNSTSLGTTIGLATGIVLAGGLMHSQLKALKHFRGKRNLIAGYHDRGLALSDVKEHIIKRDNERKIIPCEGASDRTKKIVREFKMNLALWGALIIGICTGVGRLIDSGINETKSKRADARTKTGKSQ